MRRNWIVFASLVAASGCGGQLGSSGEGDESSAAFSFPGTSSTIPSSGNYYLTSFGYSASDDGVMYCGQSTKTGSWYYAADAQRYNCGTRIAITNPATGKCAVAETDDVGPASWVENAVSMPIIDASPLVSEYLFGVKGAGNTDKLLVHVVVVPSSTPLGAGNCPSSGGGGGGGTSCYSATMAATEPQYTCVQSATDQTWYTCIGGAWVAGTSSCNNGYHWCSTSTGSVPPRFCQQGTDGVWRQCTGYSMQPPVSNWAGPAGPCSN